jgi:hypothetical protein
MSSSALTDSTTLVHTGFPLQEPEDDPFARRGSASLPLAFAPKVGLIQLDLPFECTVLQFCQVGQRFSHSLIDPGNHFDIHPQIVSQPIGGLELIEPLENRNLPTQATQAFALPAKLTFRIPPTGMQNLEGAAGSTLAPAQKIGRTPKNRVSSSNHARLLAHIGYETP